MFPEKALLQLTVPQTKDLRVRTTSVGQRRRRIRERGVGQGPNVMDIDRFVLDTCRRLKERKSYMIYTAVGCLGVSALSDLIKEVDAIQTCGGQMTADGRRFRTGGGILWNIIKVREPKAYKEIMKKAKEFEKQFKHPNTMQLTEQKKEESSQMMACGFSSGTGDPVADGIKLVAQTQNQEDTSAEGKHASIPRSVKDTCFLR
ncbi:Phosphorylated adapter RNA export protein, RNA-binding domain containing protein [Quillaja saponaria]|uniref:Phosphorylated adapter RNA export protein n=1 Tax=Quillaja saponaria TaxID=32244 RepID=A0AAD7LKC4_QUISA|nr:Phosphorylated adapter RNA export protein, RNA-binding domain containing protein [Quillaja saponaria]